MNHLTFIGLHHFLLLSARIGASCRTNSAKRLYRITPSRRGHSVPVPAPAPSNEGLVHQPPDDPGNPTVDFHGEKRSNQTHQSTTDADALLARKGSGKEAKLSYNGNLPTENRHGLIVNTEVFPANGRARRGDGYAGEDSGGPASHHRRRQRLRHAGSWPSDGICTSLRTWHRARSEAAAAQSMPERHGTKATRSVSRKGNALKSVLAG